MPRIPIAEEQVSFQPAMMQPSGGDGYSAVGKAVQGMGNAVSGFGDILADKMAKEDEFNNNLKLLNFDNAETERQIKSNNEFNRENPNGYAVEQHTARTQRFNDLLNTMTTPKAKQKAQMHFAQRGHNLYEGDLKFEYGRRAEKLVGDITATTTGEFSKLDRSTPETVGDDVQRTLEGLNQIYKSAPIHDGQRKALMKEASDMAFRKLTEVLTQDGKTDGHDRAREIINKWMQKTGIDPNAPQQQPEKQGGLFPIGGSMAGKTIDDVPSHGGAPNSRNFGGPRPGGAHGGLDIPGKTGDPVIAVGNGVVVKLGDDPGGYGPYVDVKYEDGSVHRMAHLGDDTKGGKTPAYAPGLKVGQTVKTGDALGFLGYSGNAGSEFPHVHYEVFKPGGYERTGGGGSSRSAEGRSARMDPREWFGGRGGQPQSSGGSSPIRLNPLADSAVNAAAKAEGVDPALMAAIAKIESGGDPRNTTGSYKGLFQLSNEEFSKHGGRGDIYDANSNAMAAARKIKAESAEFQSRFGRAPTAAEIYMIHQQGSAGSAAHWANPDLPAWQNMASTGEGRQKGEGWSKQAIWGNIPSDMKAKFGSVENVTSRDFVKMWSDKVQRFGGDQTAVPMGQRGMTQGVPKPGQSTDGEPSRFFFDTTRSYTNKEIDALIAKHGKDIVIGGNPEQQGHAEAMKYAASKGAKTHDYYMGAGEPAKGYGGDGKIKFPSDQVEIERNRKEMGMSREQWDKGGWLDWHNKKLVEANKAGRYSVEWDNINADDPANFGKVLERQSKFVADNGIKTKIVLKNVLPEYVDVIEKGIADGKIDPKILAPFSILESYADDAHASKTDEWSKKRGITQFRYPKTDDGSQYRSPADGIVRTNIIAGEGGPAPGTNGRVQVADAGGGVPRMVPGGQSATTEFMETLNKHLPQLAAQQQAAQDKWAKDIQSKLKEFQDVADKGGEPKGEDVGRIQSAIRSKPDLAAKYGLDQAMPAVMGYVDRQMALRTLTPTQIDAQVKATRDYLQKNGMDKEAQTRLAHLETMAKSIREGVNSDPLSWADQAGVQKVQPLDWNKPETLADRASAARVVAEKYGQEPQFFTKAERDELKDSMKMGGQQLLQKLGMMRTAFGGPGMLLAMKEIGTKAQSPVAATVGSMMVKDYAQKTIEDAAEGMARMAHRAEGQKPEGVIKHADEAQAFKDIVGTALSKSPITEDAWKQTIDAIYEVRAKRAGITKPDSTALDLYKSIIKEITGESVGPRGTYGGVHYQNSSLFGQGSNPVLVPTNMRQDGLKQALDAIYSIDELRAKPEGAKVEETFVDHNGRAYTEMVDPATPAVRSTILGGSANYADPVRSSASYFGPVDDKGRPINTVVLRRSTLVSVGDGLYLLTQGDPSSADPQYVRDNRTGKNYVLDINALEPMLRVRRPDLYKGYVPPEAGGPILGPNAYHPKMAPDSRPDIRPAWMGGGGTYPEQRAAQPERPVQMPVAPVAPEPIARPEPPKLNTLPEAPTGANNRIK